MDIDDLQKFLVIAGCNNLQQAAGSLNLTPGALSKVIKRIEVKLNTRLFDRAGRNIVLNQQGEKFRIYAENLVHEAEQAISEFADGSSTSIKISGPSVLMTYYGPKLMKLALGESVLNNKVEFNLESVWEGHAVNQVATAQAHMALVTSEAIAQSNHKSDFVRIPMGQTNFKVVAARHHPIVEMYPDLSVTAQQLLPYEFACPTVSPFCGIKRGIASDGWRDDKLSRKIGFRFSDFGALISTVKAGLAVAYVPDYVAIQNDLVVLRLVDCDIEYSEHIELVYKPSLASGWLNQLVGSLLDTGLDANIDQP